VAASGCLPRTDKQEDDWLWLLSPSVYVFPLTSGRYKPIVRGCSLIIIWGAEHYRSLANMFEEEEELRKLAVGELAGHRLKNQELRPYSQHHSKLRDDPQTKMRSEPC